MLKNYFKIAWRNLRKNRTFSIINISGLSLSVALCLLLFMHIRHEQSYDNFHANKDRLFRLEMTNLWAVADEPAKKHLFSFLTSKDDVSNSVVFPIKVAGDMERSFPEIEHVIPISSAGEILVKVGNEIFKEKNNLFVGPSFFASFSFKLKQGNPQTVLADKKNIVLSETLAKKYFGDANPVGKTIEFTGEEPDLFTVAGIAEDAPANSSIQFDMILPVNAASNYESNIEEGFNHFTHPMIIELKENVSPEKFVSNMNTWVKTYFTEPYFDGLAKRKIANKTDPATIHWSIRPLTECHYNPAYWGHYTNAKNIYQLACLVIIILLLASLNYILLTVSGSAARSQEIGVRKVMGAGRRSVILQFWVETQLMVIIAVIAGFILSQLMLPLYNNLIGTELTIHEFSWKEMLSALLVLCIGLGLLAGYYPSLIISRMKPASILKSFQTFKVNPRFARILVVAQYTACIILMMAAFVISLQMRFISNKDLGFDKEQIVMVSNQAYDRDVTQNIRERLAAFARSEPSIIDYAAIAGGLDGGGNHNGFELNGERKWLNQIDVDYSYFKMLGLKFVAGRPFSPEISDDTSSTVKASIVNESLFKLLGPTARLSEFNEAIHSTIIGVVKDYHYQDLSKPIEPQQHILAKRWVRHFMFKIKAGQAQETITKIQAAWKNITTTYPFEYTFLDQDLAKMYESELRWQKIIQYTCIFAIIIACMGLFGLSSINAVNRTKEIGIRKVLGANIRDIVSSLSVNFLVMVSISVIIGVPIAWWIMHKWLEDFAYRIHISWWMSAVVSIIAILIALITVGLQAVKAAMANPVESLRAE